MSSNRFGINYDITSIDNSVHGGRSRDSFNTKTEFGYLAGYQYYYIDGRPVGCSDKEALIQAIENGTYVINGVKIVGRAKYVQRSVNASYFYKDDLKQVVNNSDIIIFSSNKCFHKNRQIITLPTLRKYKLTPNLQKQPSEDTTHVTAKHHSSVTPSDNLADDAEIKALIQSSHDLLASFNSQIPSPQPPLESQKRQYQHDEAEPEWQPTKRVRLNYSEAPTILRPSLLSAGLMPRAIYVDNVTGLPVTADSVIKEVNNTPYVIINNELHPVEEIAHGYPKIFSVTHERPIPAEPIKPSAKSHTDNLWPPQKKMIEYIYSDTGFRVDPNLIIHQEKGDFYVIIANRKQIVEKTSSKFFAVIFILMKMITP